MSMHAPLSKVCVEAPLPRVSEPNAKASPGSVWPKAALVTGGAVTLAWIGLLGWLLIEALRVTFW
jgi:hypothetical protein